MNTSFVDEREQPTGGSSVRLGKNTATLENAQVINNEYGTSLQLDFKIGENTFKTWISEIKSVNVYGKGSFTEFSDPDAKAEYDKQSTNLKTHVKHLLRALGVTEEKEREAYSTFAPGFEGWCNGIVNMLPADYHTVELDLFLEYEKNLKEGRDRTYLRIPTLQWENGTVITDHREGSWTEYKDNGLSYKNSATGEKHPFWRSEKWLESTKAKVQRVELDEASPETATPTSW